MALRMAFSVDCFPLLQSMAIFEAPRVDPCQNATGFDSRSLIQKVPDLQIDANTAYGL